MEWERAKNYILIAFVLLNLGLAFLLFMEDRRFTFIGDRSSIINEVLSSNNIHLYTTPPRRFAPMRHLDVSGYYYNVPALLEVFFGENYFFQIETTDDGHYIFGTENNARGRLEISNGVISFDNSGALGDNEASEISHDDAIAIADEYVTRFFDDFVRDIVFTEFGVVHVIYRQMYRERLIHSNYIELLITSRGIEWIDMQFGRVIGHSADARMIFAPDEILLTFMQVAAPVLRGPHAAADSPIFINHIDIVYFQEYVSDERGSVYPAVPFYRIFVADHDFEFLINAYTNTLIN